jgi:hypothetical protein
VALTSSASGPKATVEVDEADDGGFLDLWRLILAFRMAGRGQTFYVESLRWLRLLRILRM